MTQKRVSLLFLGDPLLDRRVQSFAYMFRQAGFTVKMYYSNPGHPIAREGEGYVSLASKHTSGPRMFLSHHSQMRKHLAEISRSDVIVACDLYSLRAAAQAKQRGGKAILIYDARELYTGLPSVMSRPFVRYVWKKWERAGLLQTDFIAITAPHDADAIFRVHSFLPRPLLIRNIPLRQGAIEPDHGFLGQLGLEEDDRVAVYVGGLQSDRGLEAIVLAMKVLPPNVKLLLMGGGALESTLRDLAQKTGVLQRIIFTGPIEQGRVMSVLAACDVGLSLIETNSPSYKLALPSKIFEYLRAGLPVISTELQHVIELFDHQPYMEYVKSLNDTEIAEAVTRSLTKKTDLASAITGAADQFTFESDFEKLRLLLEERLAERR